jgi:DNA-binding transcriptional ArsR family regulator
MAAGPLTARIARYDDRSRPPDVGVVEGADPRALVGRILERLPGRDGGVPLDAAHEILDNLIHAAFRDVVVSVADAGGTIRVSDRGPGIADKRAARQLGFTTAGPREQAWIRGVGAGLAIVDAAFAARGGALAIDDNLGGGTVVTLRAPAGDKPASAEAAGAERPDPALTDRQRRCLALLADLGATGPSRVASELGLTSSTAHRELLRLTEYGLVESARSGRRQLSAQGLELLQRLY